MWRWKTWNMIAYKVSNDVFNCWLPWFHVVCCWGKLNIFYRYKTWFEISSEIEILPTFLVWYKYLLLKIDIYICEIFDSSIILYVFIFSFSQRTKNSKF